MCSFAVTVKAEDKFALESEYQVLTAEAPISLLKAKSRA
ncbi:hypothetical protein S7335_4638 [Synechococcus sp. PCC 7335]|nr:hypothetical protein S7335_4638 [Synechococcus sp. PCC 7335]